MELKQSRQSDIIRQLTVFASSLLIISKFWALVGLSILLLITPGGTKLSSSEAKGKQELGRDRFTAELCDKASREAARVTGVPVDLLLAISRTETGRSKDGNIEPWPWTVNMEGRGLWFDTKTDAMSYAYDHFKTGARSFDIGCFQINYRWHGAMFNSIEEMFDPTLNAKYAANFLKKLFTEGGDWRIAAGAFHSRTPELADRYLVKFDTMLGATSLPDGHVGRLNQKSPNHRKQNQFPLLHSGPMSVSGLASLVPLNNVENTAAEAFPKFKP